MRGDVFSIGMVRAGLVGLAMAAGVLGAEETSAKTEKDEVGIELNKLSANGSGCQAYFLFDNQGPEDYGKLKIDLVVLNSEDVFERWFVMNVAPLDAKKRTMKMYELSKMACDKIGAFLINGVVECQKGKRNRTDCVDRLVPSSRVDVEFTK